MSNLIRLFVNAKVLEANMLLQIAEQSHHYLANVMRLKEGDEVIIFNGEHGSWRARITLIAKRETSVVALDKISDQQIDKKLTLYFAPVKIVTPAWVVQKATELGVTDIIPIITERTVVSKVNLDKMQQAAIEAAEQCERNSVPKIHDAIKLSSALNNKTFTGKLLFCDERANSEMSLLNCQVLPDEDNAILIGPEGGFSPSEKEFIYSKDYALSISLGKRILRAETAFISAISIYQSIIESR